MIYVDIRRNFRYKKNQTKAWPNKQVLQQKTYIYSSDLTQQNNSPFFSKSSSDAATVPFFIERSEFQILKGRASDMANGQTSTLTQIQIKSEYEVRQNRTFINVSIYNFKTTKLSSTNTHNQNVTFRYHSSTLSSLISSVNDNASLSHYTN